MFSPLIPITHDHTVATYVACGGNPDKTGHVNRNTLTRIIQEDFGLDIGFERLIDGSGEMGYSEFEMLLSGKTLLCSLLI